MAPSIPLSYQSPQFTNPLDARLKAMNLQQMMGQQQLQQAQLQMAPEQLRALQQENEARANALKYQQASIDAAREASGLPPSNAPTAAAAAPPAGLPGSAAGPGAAPGAQAPPQTVGAAVQPRLDTLGLVADEGQATAPDATLDPTRGLAASPPAAPASRPMYGQPAPAPAASTPPPATTTSAVAQPATSTLGGFGPDYMERYLAGLQRRGVPPAKIMEQQQAFLKLQQERATLTKDQATISNNQLDAIATQAQGLLTITDPAKRQEWFRTRTVPALRAAGVPADQINQESQDLSNEALYNHITTSHMMKGIYQPVDKEVEVAAQSLKQATNQQDWEQRKASLAGFIRPQVLNGFGPWVSDAPQRAAARITSPEAQVKLPGEAAKSAEAVQAKDVSDLRNAITSSDDPQVSRDAYISKLAVLKSQGRGDGLPDAPPLDKYKPQDFALKVNATALNPEQTATGQRQAQRISIAKDRADFQRSNAGNQNRLNFLNREGDKHDALQSQEQTQWALKQNLVDAAQTEDGQDVYDPTTKSSVPIKMDSALRKRFQDEAKKAETKAMGLQQRQRQIRQRNGWGEFGPNATPAATQPPQPGPTTQGAPANPAPAPAPQGGTGTPATTQQAPQIAPTRQPGPTAPQNGRPAPAAAKTYTEADIRAWATQRGSDPEAAVKAARAKKLIP